MACSESARSAVSASRRLCLSSAVVVAVLLALAGVAPASAHAGMGQVISRVATTAVGGRSGGVYGGGSSMVAMTSSSAVGVYPSMGGRRAAMGGRMGGAGRHGIYSMGGMATPVRPGMAARMPIGAAAGGAIRRPMY